MPEFLDRKYGSFEVADLIQHASDEASRFVRDREQKQDRQKEDEDDDLYDNGHNMKVFKKSLSEYR